MVTFLIALCAWLAAGWVILAFLVGKGVVYFDDFPAYGLGTDGESLPRDLLCVLLWPYTLLRALAAPGSGTGWPGEDDNPHF